MSDLLFADYVPKNLEPIHSIGAKWLRMLAKMPLETVVANKRVCVKMHLGGGTGFTTIHPFFTRKLIERIRAAGARTVFIADSPGSVATAVERGYTTETVGCPIVSISGLRDAYFRARPVNPPFGAFREVEIGGEIAEAEALIDFSHIKGHGACGFGGASKNLSMGCVTQRSRGAIHALEGGLDWDKNACTLCKVCAENCENGAISFGDDGQFNVFYHNCKFCQGVIFFS